MNLSADAFALLLLPVAGLGASYLSETRRGVARVLLFTAWLTVAAAAVLLAVVVAQGAAAHSESITFWSFQVSTTPFRAAPKTALAEDFVVGLGFAASPLNAVLALLTALVSLLGQLQLSTQYHRDPRLAHLARLATLLTLGVLLLVLAAELFQVLVGFELAGLAAALLVGAGRARGAGRAARSAYFTWRAGGLALLLAVAFVYVKFSGPLAAAALAAQTAAAKHKIHLPTPDGLNLVALGHLWATFDKGLVAGVGGRTMAVGAVLVLAAAACACGQLPWHGQARNLGSAPGPAGGLVLALAGTVAGAGLLLETFPLLRWASGTLPALAVLGVLTSLTAAGLALREHRLRRLASWLALSQTGCVLAAIGLGATAGAVALLISASLATMALFGVVGSLAREQRVESVSQLGSAYRLAQPAVRVLFAALAAITGVLGLGTSLGHAAFLAAAFGTTPPGAPRLPGSLAMACGLVELLALALATLAAARVVLIALRGEEPKDPREARLVRRQMTQGRGASPLWPSAAATVVALLSGLVSLPGLDVGLGALLSHRAGQTSLPSQAAAQLLAILGPLAVWGGAWLVRERLGRGALEHSRWLGWADGTEVAIVAERSLVGMPALAVRLFSERVARPAARASREGLLELGRLELPGPRSLGRWQLGSALAALAGAALVIALILFAAGHPGSGMP